METARRAQIMAAAIDTIAEAGFAGASFARIAGKLGISRGLISYHFAGKDDLVKEVIHQAAEQAKAFNTPADPRRANRPGNAAGLHRIEPRIHARSPQQRDRHGRDRRQHGGRRIFYGDTDVVDAVRALEHLLSGFQTASQFVLTSTPTSWPSRSAPRSRPHRPG